jgi:hypothetical protein
MKGCFPWMPKLSKKYIVWFCQIVFVRYMYEVETHIFVIKTKHYLGIN